METNREKEVQLCNLAFQEYITRQNVISLIIKMKDAKEENEKRLIEQKINELRSKAHVLYEMRNQIENLDNCMKK